MATITPQTGSNKGVALTFSSASVGGDDLLNSGRAIMILHNASAGTIVVTATSQKKIIGLDIEDPALSILAGAYAEMGAFDPTIFDTAAGSVSLSYSGASVTGLQIAAIE